MLGGFAVCQVRLASSQGFTKDFSRILRRGLNYDEFNAFKFNPKILTYGIPSIKIPFQILSRNSTPTLLDKISFIFEIRLKF